MNLSQIFILVSVWACVAIAAIVLLVIAAFFFDVGRLYWNEHKLGRAISCWTLMLIVVAIGFGGFFGMVCLTGFFQQ